MKKTKDVNLLLQGLCVGVMLTASVSLLLGQTLTNKLNPFGAVMSLSMMTCSGFLGSLMLQEIMKRRGK